MRGDDKPLLDDSLDMQYIEKKLNKAKPVLLKAMRLQGADFELHIVPNREMERIRRTLMARSDFRGREARKIAAEKIVNVLAFPEPPSFPHPNSAEKQLGEVYLNYDFERRRGESAARRYAVLGPLLAHGFLHLLGYLHFTKRDTIEMNKEEKRLWALISS